MMALVTDKSREAFARAQRLIPGGVNSPARAFRAVGGQPVFIDRGEGPYLYDIDGNRYVDYIGSWGPLILGHRHPRVVDALRRAVEKGTSFGAPTEAESRLAELIIEAMPSVEMVRLVNSGTEATMSAIRLARAYTGRDLVVKFAGNYHGHVDSLLVAAGSSAATLAVPDSPGVPSAVAQQTLILEYNDSQALHRAFDQHGRNIAAVIIEPIVGNMGCVLPDATFLQSLRDLTQRYASVLIFDEVMTGFRVAYGGAQQLLNMRPDLTTLGKIIGGGLPVGAYGGRAEIMRQVLPSGKVFQAGTLSGNPLATAAGIATLETLRDESPYEALEAASARLAQGLLDAARSAGLPACLNRAGSMLTLFFHPGPVTNWQSASQANTKMYSSYFWALMERGIYMPCSQFEALFVSTAHDANTIDKTVEAAYQACQEVAQMIDSSA